jgi:hypothetical protein
VAPTLSGNNTESQLTEIIPVRLLGKAKADTDEFGKERPVPPPDRTALAIRRGAIPLSKIEAIHAVGLQHIGHVVVIQPSQLYR